MELCLKEMLPQNLLLLPLCGPALLVKMEYGFPMLGFGDVVGLEGADIILWYLGNHTTW